MIPADPQDDDRDELLFEDEADDENPSGDKTTAQAGTANDPWIVLAVDDEPDVHAMTALILADATYAGRPLRVISAYDSIQARRVLTERRDVAVALIDVVMEEEHAGLSLVRWIRQDLGDRNVRLILRTGQPGRFPLRDVMADYDVNDYRDKGETSAAGLYAAVVAALRAYDEIRRVARQGEAALAQDRRRQRELLQSSPVGVCAFDDDARMIFANDRLSAALGVPAERLQTVDFAEMLAEPDSDSWALRWVREGRPLRDVEVCLRRCDGSRFWALLDGGPASLDGRTVYLAWIYDIDRRKQAERGLAAARDMAVAAAAAKSVFLATMAHEIRTPMNGVLGMLELLERSPLDARQNDIVATVRDSAAALLAIVNDVLDFSKIEAGRMELDQVPLSVAAVVESVSEMIAPSARAKKLRFSCRVDPALPAATYADPVRLRQILFNLAGNAVKFTEHGSVRIRAYVLERRDGWVKTGLEIADTGIGIAPEALSRLFAPFSQAEPSIARRFGGSGLGLSITRRLVDLMDGDIAVESEPGVGSVFRIALPMKLAPEPATPDGDDDGEPRLDGLRTLIASPRNDELETAADYLAAVGARPAAAETPERAARLLRDAAAAGRPFDVVVLAEEIYPAAVAAVPHLLGRRAGEPAPPAVVLTDPDSELALRLNAGRDPKLAAGGRPVRRRTLARAVAAVAGRLIEPPRRVETATPDDAAVERPRVLVADDNPINRKVAGQQLALLGYDAVQASNGVEALALFGEQPFWGVLTDVQMPGMDGPALARAVRRAGADGGPQTRIVAFTAAIGGPSADADVFDGWLEKPLSLERLALYFPRRTAGSAASPPPTGARATGARATGTGTGTGAGAAAGEETGTTTESAGATVPADDDAPPPPAVDLQALTALCGGDAAVVLEMLDDFLGAAAEIAEAMRDAARLGDAAAMRAAAHNLRGSSRTAGAVKLAAVARRAETTATTANGDVARLTTAANDAAAALAETAAFIDALRQRP